MKGRFTILTAALALLAFLAIPMGMWGQAPVNTVLWGETWTNGAANATPSSYDFSGTTVYGGGTLTYAQSSTNTKLYAEALAGGTSPELLLSKSNQTWTISNIPTGQATEMSLTFLSNKTTFDVTSTTTGITISGSQKSWTIEATSTVSNFDLTIKNTGSSNARIDDIELKVVTAGTGGGDTPITYTVTYDANGGTGTMTDTNSPYNAGATVTVLGNEFTRTDYEFDHWNTAADDSGDSYDEDDTFTINANTTLYAQWTENTTPGPGGDTETVIIDFEDNQLPSGWTVSNFEVVSNPISGTSATNGSYACSTGGKTSASLTSNNSFENVVSISIDASKTSTNTNTSLYIDFCPDSNFGNGDTQTQQVTNIPRNSWETTTLALSSATTGYVRIRWAGTTAVKYIDNIVITCESSGGTSAPSISADDVNIAYDAEEGTITYTINNPVEGGSITASTEAEWLYVDDTPQTDAEGSIDFICAPNSNFYAHSATVTLTYTYGDSKATVTKEVTVTQAKDPNANGSTAEYPITVSEALEAIDEVETVSDIYVGGIVSAIVDEYSSTYHNITFDMIDEDGDEYYLRAYRCVGTDGVNASEVAVGDEVVVYGTLFKYNNSIYEFQQGCQLVSLIHPAVPSITVNPDEVNVDAEEHDGTLDLTYENLTITEMSDFDIQFCDANGDELSEEPDWIEVLVASQDPEIGEGYVVSYYMVENEGTEARTAYFKVYAMDEQTNLVYSNLVTISQAAPVVPPTPGNWVLTNLADLTEDDIFVIVGTDADDDTFALPNDGGASTAPLATAITIVESTISGEPAVELQWNLSGNATDGYIFYPNGTTETWLYCTNANNGVRVGTNANKTFNIDEDGYMVNDATSRVLSIYVNNGTPQDWRCYINYNNNPVVISFYKKVVEPATETYPLTVDAYTDDNLKNGYNLIASPVNVNPATVAGMTEGDFDLYSFDESQEDEWRNYEATAFNLVPGKGYLYAKKATTENQTYSFELTGIPYNNEPIILSKSESGDFPGWNLVGNPFGETAVLSDNRDFYVMNSDGSDFIQGSGNIAPMQGIFVIADRNEDVLVFTPVGSIGTGPIEDFKLVLNLTKGRGIIDRAVVRFGEGRTLPKFMLNADNTKLYITEGNQDFAVVRSNNEGEMPVSFKAAENGNYTLSVEAENVEASYLHLIDNMTGADVDLLATPSYSFDARTTDYENRFRLVFNTNGVEENNATANFAYFNGSSWTVNNMGEATLQVVDVMGRVLSTETISGNTEVNLNQAAGVYMLRLLNGNDVKVQKVVVK